ncbi:uncharacterized protein LTR77_004576 [Saxophila tyrrhenica]|uniref:Uncharacterized protein n=1 Tax=Saxophila tyrrhenica TaxID=1690608 RepID=A0AAV9PGJ1_9PEZI|nr:hypothetical protein LTR77_004576 [Saxophila tyrrhenica]
MEDHYSFGIEIEMIAKPKQAGSLSRPQTYYVQFASALRLRGINARADDLSSSYRKRTEEYTRGWWITKDGSISHTGSAIALGAVSPILFTSKDWEAEIDGLWKAQLEVFRMPEKATECGSHVHISPGTARIWTDEQPRNIAVGVARYEEYLAEMLPVARRDNSYCLKNTASSTRLRDLCSHDYSGSALLAAAKDCSRSELIQLMQTDRKVVWNFKPAATGGIGTIEFRGGRHLRGPVRTKRWIAFAVSFTHFLLEAKACTRGRFPPIYSTHDLYNRIRSSATDLALRKYLPLDYNVLNETKRTPQPVRHDLPPFSFPPPAYPREPPPAYTAGRDRGERSESVPAYSRPSCSRPSYSRPHFSSSDLDEWGPWPFNIAYCVLRLLQFVLGLTVAGIYGHAIEVEDGVNIRFGFAEVVAIPSMLTALGCGLYCLYEFHDVWTRNAKRRQWMLELFLAYVQALASHHPCAVLVGNLLTSSTRALWLVLFICSAALDLPDERNQPTLAHTVWLIFVNLLLWLVSAGSSWLIHRHSD